MSVNIQSLHKLSIAIIGAGIVGLATAAFLRKHPRYSVTVYERRNAQLTENSAAIGIRTDLPIVKQLGISRDEIDAVVCAGYRTYTVHEEQMSKSSVGDGPDGDGAMWLVIRQDLKDALLRRVTCREGDGEPIRIVYGSQVVNVDPDAGLVQFDNGTSAEVDLIIGADGIHSTVQPSSHLHTHGPSQVASPYTRFVIPMDAVKSAIEPTDKWPAMYNCGEDTYISIVAADGDRHAVMYPCRGHTFMNVGYTVSDSSFKDLNQLDYSWRATGSVDEMVESAHGFPAWLRRVFSRTPKVDLFSR
ncbi:FAD/NAD(P)-binding domain-containing protein [Byssothecium circinans]|uniref:FAD/NAD(P)-binding domain-containing protein n=1 Tax=Byssothecium circinans TaxID=147558 RepID=A0A6A5T882_9PLEO|nr:FAD/NAD(P)-binding domain-containing protein [Byssothecium circinans]